MPLPDELRRPATPVETTPSFGMKYRGRIVIDEPVSSSPLIRKVVPDGPVNRARMIGSKIVWRPTSPGSGSTSRLV
jgi:hypothetical protein